MSIPAARLALSTVFALLVCTTAAAQDNYEIQVYPSETVAPKTTMIELHSNFLFQGSKTTEDGVTQDEDVIERSLRLRSVENHAGIQPQIPPLGLKPSVGITASNFHSHGWGAGPSHTQGRLFDSD